MRFLERYESLGVIGRGSMGEVHAAQDLRTPGRRVVVKVMRPEVASTPRARELFEREMANSMRLRHHYIVRVFEVGVGEHGPCIVMEMIDGHAADDVLKHFKRFDLERTVWLLGCMGHALRCAHKKGIIHRDLKPANLMITNAGTREESLKVMDFGLAMMANKPYISKERLAGSEAIRAQGTPAYIAPEQLRGDQIDLRSDLYSVGVILFEMLTGQLPFQAPTLDGLIQAHLHRKPPRFADLGVRDVPPRIEELVQRALCKYPSERPETAFMMVREFSEVLDADIWESTKPPEIDEDPTPVPPTPHPGLQAVNDPNAIVRVCEAWMPDRIAVVKINGFLHDTGGVVTNTEPGVIQARYEDKPKVGFLDKLVGTKPTPLGIDLAIQLDKPNPAVSKLLVTTVFRMYGQIPANEKISWQAKCHQIADELRRYLIAG